MRKSTATRPWWRAPGKCRRILLSTIIVLAIWGVFSWPLPRHAFSGIPSSAHNTEKNHVRFMIPGDHLQLMYHFWLMSDMLAGQTPLLHNPYEFNIGNDQARFEPNPYFLPFSFLFSLIQRVGGRAFGWNLTGLLSLGIGFFATWLLAERYSGDRWSGLTGAVVGLLLPFTWISLFGGSPTGFAIALMPPILLGIDMAIRDSLRSGGILAGVSFVLASFADLHVFYFSILVAVPWCLVALAMRPDIQWKRPVAFVGMAVALLPCLLLGGLSVAYRSLKTQVLADTGMADGWSLRELSLFSPHRRGLVSYENLGVSNHVFLGYVLPVFLFAGLCAVLVHAYRTRNNCDWRRGIAMLMLCTGMTAIICLALGTNGPLGGKLLLICRKAIPNYTMIRQPVKVYCLMPAILAVCTAMSTRAVWTLFHRRRRVAWALVLPLLLCSAFESASHVDATVSLLATQQKAYEAVARRSSVLDQQPHAIIVPLWPGNSAWSSVYEHYVSLYRVRMVNGYSPSVRNTYVENIFRRYESINKGDITEERLAELRDMGVNHIILHEDAFPEKVSPLPVCLTIKNLIANPELSLLARDGPVWAFSILPSPVKQTDPLPEWNTFFPSRRWEFESTRRSGIQKQASHDASAEGFVTLTQADQTVRTKGVHMSNAPRLRWKVRGRGHGKLEARSIVGNEQQPGLPIELNENDWAWFDVPIRDLSEYEQVSLEIEYRTGEIHLDTVLLTAGSWQPPEQGETLTLDAPLFFHAGYTDMATETVVFKRHQIPAGYEDRMPQVATDIEGDRGVFYGPRLPLNAGPYAVHFTFTSTAAPGSLLGGFYVRAGNTVVCTQPVLAGQPAKALLHIEHNLPVSFNFLYAGTHDMAIHGVSFLRL